MKAIDKWNYKPFANPTDKKREQSPFVCRIVPGEGKFGFEWFDNGFAGEHIVSYRKYQSLKPETTLPLLDKYIEINGLEDEQNYEFIVKRVGDEGESAVRLVRTGYVPGTVINYVHPEDKIYQFSGCYLSSPGLIKLPSGDLMASMDLFQYGGNMTLLYKSKDKGVTWEYVNDLFPAFWGKLFLNKGSLYFLCVDDTYGSLIIGRSDDEGETWTPPIRLISSCARLSAGGVHKSAVPVVNHDGRIWSAVEYGIKKGELMHRQAALVSADENSDLLDPASWRCTEFLPYDRNWEGSPECFHLDFIEGNAVVSPDGCICNFMRLEAFYPSKPVYNKAIILKSEKNDPDAPLKFDRIVDAAVGIRHKFLIQKEPKTGKYVILGNENGEDKPQRTVLSMSVSDDFYNWKVVKRILDFRDADPGFVGFQYPDFIFEGDDILFLSRTAFNQANSFHNNNYITFHTIDNYMQYLE